MGCEWALTTVGEVAHQITKATTPTTLGRRFVESGIAFVKVESITDDGRFQPDKFAFIDEETNQLLGRSVLQEDDVLFTIAGTIGRVARVDASILPANTNQAVAIVRPNRTVVDPRFLFYVLRDRQRVRYAQTRVVQSVQANFSLAELSDIEIPLPTMPEQRAIAHILGTLDDKIELNRRMSETLEAMARAIFKAWFVDFLPVRAKMAAKANDPSLLLPQAEAGTWYVYAIECNDGSLYIGQTEDLRQRWLQHVGGKGASWTKTNPPVNVPYWEKQPSREAAVERENWLKTGYGRKWLKKEIAARTQTGEPVRAKMEGRLSASAGQAGWRRGESLPLPAPQSEAARQAGGLPAHLYDLFPDRLVDSELGEIPEGWEVKPFAETVEIIGGGTPKTSVAEYWNGDIPWFSVVDAPPESDVWVIDTEKKITQSGVENSSTRILPVGTTIISARGTVGRVALVGVPMAMNQSCYGLLSKADCRGFFPYFATRDLVASLRQHAHGSVFDTITRATLAGVLVVAPSAELIEAFENLVGPSMERIRAGLFQSRTLAALRDTLLPKLISGELRVENADAILTRAGA